MLVMSTYVFSKTSTVVISPRRLVVISSDDSCFRIAVPCMLHDTSTWTIGFVDTRTSRTMTVPRNSYRLDVHDIWRSVKSYHTEVPRPQEHTHGGRSMHMLRDLPR